MIRKTFDEKSASPSIWLPSEGLPEEPQTRSESSHWRHLDRLFQGALQRSPEKRRAYLARCAPDRRLQREAEALLAAHAAAEGFLDAPAWRAANRSGQRLGPWRVERPLGQGGMGAVYLARRDDRAYKSQVAVKMLAPFAHGAEIERRFRAERHILARLEHPHIARLLDAGRAPDGALYYVMEYVDGEPVDVACDRRRYSVEQRLELFRTICDAVQYAHRNLVVHRDLKPANILLTPQGVPKLLDFGIAKLLEPDPELPGEPTRTGLAPLTPNHASPEQLRGQPITTAADVYALGVLLYQLLTGRLPRRFDSLEPLEVERRLRQPPTPPSLAVSSGDADAVAERAAKRQLSPAALRRRLAGDLDHVVAKALREEPERRYASAERLADDTSRHLAGQSVEARHGAWGYRAMKFLRRHRLPVLAAALFLALLVGYFVLMAFQAQRLEHERDQARQVASYLTHLLGDAELWENEGRGTTVRQLLERGSAEILQELDSRPQPILLLKALASACLRAGLGERAAELATAALAEHRHRGTEGTRDDLERAEIYTLLGRSRAATGDFETAEEHQQRAHELRRRHLALDDPVLAESWRLLGSVALNRGHYSAAEEYFSAALDVLREDPDADPVAVGELLTEYATLLGRSGQLQRGNHALAQAESLLAAVLEPDDPRLLAPRMRRGVHHLHLFELDRAEEILTEVVEDRRRLLGPEHPETLEAQFHLGAVFREQGRHAKSEALLRDTAATARRVFGGEHLIVGETLGHLAGTLGSRGEFAAAEALFHESREILEGATSSTPDASNVLMYEGHMIQLQGRAQEAEPVLRQAREELARLLPDSPWQVATADIYLGLALLDLERLDDAERHLRLGIERLEDQKARYLRPLCPALQAMARLNEARGDTAEAARYRGLESACWEGP